MICLARLDAISIAESPLSLSFGCDLGRVLADFHGKLLTKPRRHQFDGRFCP